MEELQEYIYSYLRHSRYFEHISDEMLNKVLVLAKFRKYVDGEVVMQQGEENHEVFFIMKGAVSVKVDGRFIYNLSRKGDIFGEMSVITGQASSATIESHRSLEVITISASLLRDIHHDASHELHHIFYRWFSRILADKLQRTSQKAKLYEDINKQLQEDLEAARLVQQEVFVSSLETIQTFPLLLKCEYADTLGGDLYGVFDLGKNRYGVLLGDVSGHGTAASLLAVTSFNFFQHFSRGLTSSEQVMTTINRLMLDSMPEGRFVTVFYAIYDAATQELTYSNGGHHPAILIRENRVSQLPPSYGMPLGAFENHIAQFTEKQFQFQAGDRMLLFTDCAFESIPKGTSGTGFEQLLQFIEAHTDLEASALLEEIYEYGKSFTEGKYEDDFTLMIFEQT